MFATSGSRDFRARGASVRRRRRRARARLRGGRASVVAAGRSNGSARSGPRGSPTARGRASVRARRRRRHDPLRSNWQRGRRMGYAAGWRGAASERLYPWSVRRNSTAGRFAERMLTGVDDTGVEERVVIWIERKPGALWAVGRAVNPQHRPTDEPRHDDYVFEGYELEDALEAANGTLEDDVSVLEQDGNTAKVKPFVRDELLKPLERYFFGHTSA